MLHRGPFTAQFGNGFSGTLSLEDPATRKGNGTVDLQGVAFFGLNSTVIEDLYDALPRRLGEARLTDLIDDRRFAETVYQVALADGVTYQDPPEDAS